MLGARGERLDWPCRSFADLTAEHFAQLATLNAEIVIFGSGLRNRFPPPAWLKPLITQRIGLETIALLKQNRDRLHSRKLRAFDEPPFR